MVSARRGQCTGWPEQPGDQPTGTAAPAPAARSRRRPARPRPARTSHGPNASAHVADQQGDEGERLRAASHSPRLEASSASRKPQAGRDHKSALSVLRSNPRLNGFDCKLFLRIGGRADWQKGFVMPTLFDPLQLGAIELPNRILMAPLTRARAGREAVPNATDGRLLCPARRRRPDHLRSDRNQPRGPRLAQRAGPVERGAGRRLEAGHRGRAPGRRADRRPAVAHGPAGPSRPRRRPAGLVLGDDRARLRPHL